MILQILSDGLPFLCIFSSGWLVNSISFFIAQTRLGNPEVRRIVEQSVQENLTEFLELHPDVLDSILSKSLNALKVHGSCNIQHDLEENIFFIIFIVLARWFLRILLVIALMLYVINSFYCRLPWQLSELEN